MFDPTMKKKKKKKKTPLDLDGLEGDSLVEGNDDPQQTNDIDENKGLCLSSEHKESHDRQEFFIVCQFISKSFLFV